MLININGSYLSLALVVRSFSGDIHGIKINVLQTGQLGTFSITTLIVQLTTSLALLKLTTTIVDVLAVSVLPHRVQYRNAKVDEIMVDDLTDDPVLQNPKMTSLNYGSMQQLKRGAARLNRPLLPGTIAPGGAAAHA